MAGRSGAWIAAALLAGGCSPLVDNAANIPQRGKWQRETRLLALVANDVWVDRKRAPFEIPPDTSEIKPCIEPALKSRDEINRDMLGRTQDLCRFDTLDQSAGKVTGTGTCSRTANDGEALSGTIEFDGTEKPDRIDGKVHVELAVRDRRGRSERMRIGMETLWTRLGDCGS